MPKIDQLVDATVGFERMSFLDAYSRYNQIRMNEKDIIHIAFITERGIYCHKVMSFGLKNGRATYQMAMVTLFYDMMHKEIEVYLDDMITKSKKGESHVYVFKKKLFEKLRKYKPRLNPAKCSFGVKYGKLLGFVESDKGIEVGPDKVKII